MGRGDAGARAAVCHWHLARASHRLSRLKGTFARECCAADKACAAHTHTHTGQRRSCLCCCCNRARRAPNASPSRWCRRATQSPFPRRVRRGHGRLCGRGWSCERCRAHRLLCVCALFFILRVGAHVLQPDRPARVSLGRSGECATAAVVVHFFSPAALTPHWRHFFSAPTEAAPGRGELHWLWH